MIQGVNLVLEVMAMKNVLFVASEGVPFIKTGGLADVVGSLPKCFDKKYFDVRVMIPKYTCISQKMKDLMQYKTHFYMLESLKQLLMV